MVWQGVGHPAPHHEHQHGQARTRGQADRLARTRHTGIRMDSMPFTKRLLYVGKLAARAQRDTQVRLDGVVAEARSRYSPTHSAP